MAICAKDVLCVNFIVQETDDEDSVFTLMAMPLARTAEFGDYSSHMSFVYVTSTK
jgi:hypothetical protein